MPKTLLLSVVLLGGLGCTKPHPVERIPVPNGESIFTLKNLSGRKVVVRMKGHSSETLAWDLKMNDENGGTWGNEKLYDLDDGKLIYCGISLDPELVRGCWVIDDTKATRIAEPIFRPNPTLMDSAGRTVDFASNGAWWATIEDRLEFSPSRDKPAVALQMPVSGPYQMTTYAPETDRFAVMTKSNEKCEISVVTRASMELVDTFPLKSCYTRSLWNADGKTLGILDESGLTLWEPLGRKKQIFVQTKGPDGRDEELRLLAFSPDSTRVLIRSSRYQKVAYNRCAGVYNAIFETFVVDIASGEWKRLPVTGDVVLWRKDQASP